MSCTDKVASRIREAATRTAECVVLIFYLYGYATLTWGSGRFESALAAAIWAQGVFAKIVLPIIICTSALLSILKRAKGKAFLSVEVILRLCVGCLGIVGMVTLDVGHILHLSSLLVLVVFILDVQGVVSSFRAK